MVCGLNSICDLSCGDLCNDRTFRGGRELGRTTRMRWLMVGKEVLEYSGDSRLADTQGGGNITSRMTITGQREDVFLLSRGDGAHGEE